MRRKLTSFKTYLFALVLFIVTSQSAFADTASEMQGTLNNLVTPKLINESNKPFLADRNQLEEIIDPQTGSLTVKKTDLNLPGRDGLDLNIGRVYNSSQAEVGRRSAGVSLVSYHSCTDAGCTPTVYWYTTQTLYNNDNYLYNTYDLGSGWSFAFPSLQMEGEAYYYYDGTGASYEVDRNYNNLKDYPSKGVQFWTDPSYSNGQSNSFFVFIDRDQKKTYFDYAGRLIGIKDRNGNEIKFLHQTKLVNVTPTSGGQTITLLSQIIDSVGRTVTFDYETKLTDTNFAGENITVTVNDPANTKSYAIQYTKYRDLINGVYKPKLWRVTEAYNTPLATSTYYNYTAQSSLYNYGSKDLVSNTLGANMTVMLLNSIQYPNSSSSYEYESVDRNLGNGGLYQAFRVKNRKDVQLTNGSPIETNKVSYNYTNDISGYPLYADTVYEPDTYTYSSESVQTNNLKVKNIFNKQQQPTRTETTANNNERNVVINTTFDTNFKYFPIATEIEDYNASNGMAEKVYSSRSYDGYGNLLTSTIPIPAAQYNVPATKEKYTTTIEYNTYNWPTKKTSWQNLTDTTPSIETYAYYDNLNNDGVGKFGRVKSVTNAIGETSSYSYLLNSTNQVQTVVQTKPLENAKTAKIETDYGVSTNYAYPTETRTYYTNAANQYKSTKSSKSYDMLLGLLKSDKDNSQRETTYAYDALGRLTSTVLPNVTGQDGNSYKTEQSFEYSPSELVQLDIENFSRAAIKVHSYTKTTNLTANTALVTQDRYQFYNPFGQLILQRFNDTDRNQLINEVQMQYDNQSRPIKSVDALGNTNSLIYGPWGDAAESVDAYGNHYFSQYDIPQRKQTSFFVAAANLGTYASTPSQKENLLETYSNALGQQISRKAYPDSPSTTNAIQESYAYDVAGNLLTYTDPKGYSQNFSYDKLNRLTAVTDPLTQKTTYTYTKLGQLNTTQQTDGTSTWVTEKQYDEAGILTKSLDPVLQGTLSLSGTTLVHSPLGTIDQKTDAASTSFGYLYDELNRLKTENVGIYSQKTYYNENPFGPQKREDLENGGVVRSTAYTYTGLGLLKTKQFTADGYTQSTANQYDTGGRLTQIKQTESGFATNYIFDKTRLQKVQTDGSSTASFTDATKYANYEYNPNGTLKQLIYPTLSGGLIVKSVYEYDAINRLKKVKNYKGSNVLSQYEYEYDANSNITAVTDASGRTVYDYDKLNRLKTVTRPDASLVNYTYDARGNRQTMLTSSNLLSDLTDTSYAYDVWNRLTSVVKGGATTNFTYEPDGLRSKKVAMGGTTRYTYNEAGKVIAESNATNQTTANYTWGPDRLLSKKESNGGQYYYLYNGHGDVVQIIDSTGTVVKTYQYDEWGNTLTESGSYANAFKYAGELYDEESGLYYLRARYYDPIDGRFITKDTNEGQSDNPLTLNLYTYVENNPLSYVDHTGHKSEYFDDDEAVIRSSTRSRLPRDPDEEFIQDQYRMSTWGVKINGMTAEEFNKLSPQAQANVRASFKYSVERLKKDGKIERDWIMHDEGTGERLNVPLEAYVIGDKILKNKGTPPTGIKGGRIYENDGRDGGEILPGGTTYKEYDINPKETGTDRGKERLVFGLDGTVWYTNDHYNTFTQIR